MKDGKLGFGILGCGVIAPTHREAIEACGEAYVAAVCDVEKAKAVAFAEASGNPRVYTDHEDLIRDPEVDAVCICTPSGIHGDGVIAAAEAGKHAFCEKPLDISSVRMGGMIEACRTAGVKLGCVFQSRTQPEMIRIREAVAGGRLGPMTLADAYLKSYRSQEYYRSAGWRGTWSLDGGGALMNQGVHGVDLVQWLMNDEVVRVFARSDHKVRDIEVEDTSVACVEYAGGAYGVIEGTTSCNPGEDRRIELHGKYGSILIRGNNITRWATTSEEDGRAVEIDPGTSETEAEGVAADHTALTSTGHVWLIEDMVRAVKDDRDPFITGESARKAVDLILAIYASSRTGTDVSVADVREQGLPIS